MHLNDMTGIVHLEDLSGTTVINGMVYPCCGYKIIFRSLQGNLYDFSLYFTGLGYAKCCLSARLMDNITNGLSVRLWQPASMNEFVGSFEIAKGYGSEIERKSRYFNELEFQMAGSQNDFSLNMKGKTHKSIPVHLNNFEFDITVQLNREMVQLLREVSSLDHDA